MKPVYSLIIPCYNEQEVIAESYRRLTAVMQGMGESYELLFINDGSKDATARLLNELAERDERVRVVHFARNHGHQIAVSAGLDYAVGQALVIIDADLQDPPELIPQMAALWKDGAQVVYGQRRSRRGESFLKLKTAELYYRLIQKLTGGFIPRDTGDFRLVDDKVADVVRGMPEHARFLRGLFAWVGFKQVPLLYDRDPRFAGQTHYPLKKMLRLAADGILSFSDKPLKLPLFLGLVWLALGGLMMLILLVLAILGRQGGLWWLASLMLLGFGSVLTALGILGSYLARVYDDVKERPLYIVADTRGFEHREPEPYEDEEDREAEA